jgi:Uma2 family endonuclease
VQAQWESFLSQFEMVELSEAHLINVDERLSAVSTILCRDASLHPCHVLSAVAYLPIMTLAALPPTAPPLARITCDMYHAMIRSSVLGKDNRVELIHGFLVTKQSSSSLHSGTVNRLCYFLTRLLTDDVMLRSKSPITIHDYSEPEPDIVIAKFRSDFYAGSHPEPKDVLVAIEIADTSLAYDRDAKIPLYASCGIPEAWLVDIIGKTISVFSHPEGAAYSQETVYTSGMNIPLTAVSPGTSLSLADLGF